MKHLDPTCAAARDLASGRYLIRVTDGAGLARVHIPWMREAGWNPGRHDAETFFSADPRGFLIGELDGEPIACVSGVRYDATFGFIGCYIVQERHRGQGYGLAIHEAVRAHLAGCTQGGDGVLANVKKYEQIGRVYAYRNARYQGRRTAEAPRHRADLVDLRDVLLNSVVELDRECFPAPRRAFLETWIHQPEAIGWAMRDAASPESLRGYGVMRRCFEGWKIGPLFARDDAAAEALFGGLTEQLHDGESFFLDIPEPNVAAVALVKRHHLVEAFATARMYTGPFPRVNLDWVYGVTTFELG
jgi:hypothetical protein